MTRQRSIVVLACLACIALFCISFVAVTDAATKPCRDRDGDGYFGSEGCGTLVDCNDRDSSINPGATEICDGNDNNCDGLIDEGFDADGDGYTICGGDCDDTNPAVNPGVKKERGCDCFDGLDNECDGAIDSDDRDCRREICDICIPTGLPDDNCDDIDDDCNGIPDDGYVPTPTTCGLGVCTASGQLECQGGTEVDTCTPGPQDEATDVTCDGLDGDCDGQTDEDFASTPTTCGLGVCASTGDTTCVSGVPGDTCTPGPQAEPTDVTCDGLDGDCDGLVDEDYVTTPTTCGDGVCAASGAIECQGGAEVDTCTPGPQNEPTDVTCDGLDGDCDGLVDEDYVTMPTSCGDGVCLAAGTLECQGGTEVDTCTPGLQDEATDVTCDGLDGDCDGLVDEDYVTTPTTCGDGVCAASGAIECQGGAEVDTCTPGPQNEPTDVTCDGLDGDCDGLVDEDYVTMPTSCGDGVCLAAGTLECQGGTEVDTCTPGLQDEATDVTCDGLNGDCDGFVDEDYITTPTSCGVGECAGNTGQLECQAGGEVDTCDPFAGALPEGPDGDPTCEDGLDNDCDGATDTLDADCACVLTGLPDNNCDGVDDDCDGTPDDEYVITPTSCGDGVCTAAGTLECQGGTEVDTCTPGPQNEPTDVTCDGLDGDCDGLVDEDYVTTPTSCGDGVCAATGAIECQSGSEVDTCTPGPQNEPTDVTCDGLDGDCDGLVDEDYVTTPTSCGDGVCAASGAIECQGGAEVDTCTPGPQNEPTDVTCDGLDGDCDGLVDEDYVTTPTSCGDGVCAASGAIECQGGAEVDTCTPGPQNEPTDVTCDGLDGDCDGFVDEDYITTPTSCGVGECAGNTGQLECQAGGEVDTCDPFAGALPEGPDGDPTCEDGLDNDCDGATDTLDADCACVLTGLPDNNCDGVDDDCDGTPDDEYVITPTSCGDGVCTAAGTLECQGGTEVDTCTPGPQNEPTDVTCDGLDGDCDGLIDEDYVTTPTSCGDGVCAATGAIECQSGAEVDTCTPGPQNEPTDVTCDGLDGDCDGLVDEDYVTTPTSCGDGVCAATGQLECVAGVENDTCTPGPQNEPTDVTCDGLDGDCDGLIDEDYVTTPTSCGDGVCAATGAIECQGGAEVDTCTPGPQNEPTDVTCDGLDGDCDGLVDEDYVTIPTSCGDGVCAATGQLECVAGVENDTCTPGPQNEPTDVTCDGLDGDCDGQVDEDYVTTPTSCGDGVCLASGTLECQGGTEVDTCTPGPQNEPTDVTCDGLDGDCDGAVDEDYVPSTTQCGVGVCASTGLLDCIGGTEVDDCTPGNPTEDPEATCDDGLDNDCDGLTDLDDITDCAPQTCIDCHNGIPSGGSGYVTRDVVGVDYVQPSRHVFGGTVTNWDCIVCHREGDAAQAASGTVANTTLHQNAQVEMRNVDSILATTIATDDPSPNDTVDLVWDNTIASNDMYTALDYFCMSCHDLDGASGINVKATDDGVNLGNSRSLTPFNSSDGLSSTGTQGGTVWQATYERTRVLDVFSKFDPNNPSHHAVRGQAYSSHNTSWGDSAWVSRTLNSGDNLTGVLGVYEAARLHCTDCHTENSHGGPNGFRLQASSIDATCYLCHNQNVYSASQAPGSRWNHNQDPNVWGSSDLAVIGQYGTNTGSACMNCHGGRIGEAGNFQDGFGGIHGLPASPNDPLSNQPRYRFQGGSYMSHQPGSWTTTAADMNPTCYFSTNAAGQDWTNCSRHASGQTNRTGVANYDRGVPGDY